MDTIPVVLEKEDVPESGTLGVFTPKAVIQDVNVETLKKSLSSLSENISNIMTDIRSVGGFQLKQVQLSVEISAEGGVAIIGTAKAGAKGAIMLTFSNEDD